MKGRKKLNQKEVRQLFAIQDKLVKLRDRIEINDVELGFNNGMTSEQIGCAIGALECILQEYV